MKTINVSALTLLCALFFSSAQAVSYQKEVSGQFMKLDFEGFMELTTLTANLQYYFQPVSYVPGPYAEQNFLQRTANVRVGAGTAESDLEAGFGLDGTAVSAGLEYSDKNQPFTFLALYQSIETDGDLLGISMDMGLDTQVLGIGFYPDEHSLIGLLSVKNEAEFDTNPPTTFGGSGEQNILSILYKNLLDLGSEKYLALEVQVKDIEDVEADTNNTELSAELVYYSNRLTGFTFGLETNSGDMESDEGNGFTIGVQNFFSDTAFVQFQLSKFSADLPDEDVDQITMTFGNRF